MGAGVCAAENVQNLQGFQSEQDDWWIFGSGATRSRARSARGKVQACRVRCVGRIVAGERSRRIATGAVGCDACDDTEFGACPSSDVDPGAAYGSDEG